MIVFHAFGHANIKATHKTTMEFTKEEYVTEKGDCIVGVRADFDAKALARLAKRATCVKIVLRTGGLVDEILGIPNPRFDDDRELVIRMGEYASSRTFATRADKSSRMISREMIKALQLGSPVEVSIEETAK